MRGIYQDAQIQKNLTRKSESHRNLKGQSHEKVAEIRVWDVSL
jgi:hypothetical protein